MCCLMGFVRNHAVTIVEYDLTMHHLGVEGIVRVPRIRPLLIEDGATMGHN